MKWACRSIATAAVVVGLACPSWAGQVKLVLRDGLVTLDAKDATLREILSEWARVGQTRFVNAESMPGAPMTVQLTGVPERQALQTLLRSAAGFVAAPKTVLVATGSVYDRIVLMPGVRPAGVPMAAGSMPSPVPQQPYAMRDRLPVVPQPVVVDDPEDDPTPTAAFPMPAVLAGAPQPGMMTAPPTPPAGSANSPAMMGSPFGNSNNPYAPAQGATANPTAPPVPLSAPRPGLPTVPPPPIKGPGGSSGTGVE